MKKQKGVKVGIIGVHGKYGTWLKNFFERNGNEVIGSDVEGIWTKNRQIVEQADVVIFAVPISTTASIIEDVVEFSREGQLFMDITSIKKSSVRAMLESKANVVGLHPMCVPPKLGKTLRGQVIVRCDARLTKKWKTWVDKMLVATQARVKQSTSEEHDRYMAVVQGLTHAVALIMSNVIRAMQIDVAEINEYVSPPYKVSLAVMGRILNQNPCLYGDIQIQNEIVLEVLKVLECEVKSFRKMVKAKDMPKFVSDFVASREYFGKEVASSNELFVSMIKCIANSKKRVTS